MHLYYAILMKYPKKKKPKFKIGVSNFYEIYFCKYSHIVSVSVSEMYVD